MSGPENNRDRAPRSWLLRLGVSIAAGLMVLCAHGAALADPVRGAAQAKTSEFKKGSVELARTRALRRARTAALQAAFERLEGPVDRAAKRAVIRSGQGWTGAYRVLSESVTGSDGDEVVQVEIEADIDLARLAKRVMPRPASSTRPLYRFGSVREAAGCDARLPERLQAELEGVGALGGEDSTPVVFGVRCQELGSVPHTFIAAARVDIVARVGKRVVARGRATGLGATADAAQAVALQEAIEATAAELDRHRRGRVRVRVLSPLPAARVRRLERALDESVMGVASVEVVGLDLDGAVVLQVEGNVTGEGLGQRMEALRLPGFSVNMHEIEGPDAITVYLR